MPSIILKACLDDMVDKSGSSSDEYTGTLCLKDVGNVNNNLYYIDHTDTIWECNFCQAKFSTFEKASEHEKMCLDRKLPPKREKRIISLFKSMRINDGELTSPEESPNQTYHVRNQLQCAQTYLRHRDGDGFDLS